MKDTPDTLRPHRYAKGAARRQEIIRAAMSVFSTIGYNKSSMLEISEKVGLTRAGLAHYFPTKESLLTAVLEWRDSEDHRAFMRTEPSTDAASALEFFRGLLRLTAHNSTVPGVIALYSMLTAEASAPDHPAHDFFVRRFQGTIAMMTRNLTVGRSVGIVRDSIDIADFAVRITAVMDGLQLQWLLAPTASATATPAPATSSHAASSQARDFDMVEHLRRMLQEALTVPLEYEESLGGTAA